MATIRAVKIPRMKCPFFVVPTTYRPPLPTTYRPHTVHILTTYRPPLPITCRSHTDRTHTDHMPTTCRLRTDHISTTHQPRADHVPTTFTNHIPTIYRPHTNHKPTTIPVKYRPPLQITYRQITCSLDSNELRAANLEAVFHCALNVPPRDRLYRPSTDHIPTWHANQNCSQLSCNIRSPRTTGHHAATCGIALSTVGFRQDGKTCQLYSVLRFLQKDRFRKKKHCSQPLFITHLIVVASAILNIEEQRKLSLSCQVQKEIEWEQSTEHTRKIWKTSDVKSRRDVIIGRLGEWGVCGGVGWVKRGRILRRFSLVTITSKAFSSGYQRCRFSFYSDFSIDRQPRPGHTTSRSNLTSLSFQNLPTKHCKMWSNVPSADIRHVISKCETIEGPTSQKMLMLIHSTLSKRTLSKPDSKFGPLPAELHLYLCNGTLSKADTSLNRTVALVPRVSALERVDCS